MQDHPEAAVLRVHAHRNLMCVAWVLARHADWAAMTSRPTWAVLMERTGLSRSTVAAWLAWLRRAGLLGTVTPGTTVRYRRGTACGLIDDGRGNEAAEYVLAVPVSAEELAAGDVAPAPAAVSAPAAEPVDETRTPSCLPVGDIDPALRGRAREEAPEALGTRRRWSMTATLATRRDMLAACQTAREQDLTLRRLSTRHLRSLLRCVFAEGGTLGDALHMINIRPDGTPWPYAGTPRYLPGWARHRLAAWLTEDGRLREGLVLPSRARAAAAERTRAEQQMRRAELAERAGRSVQDVTGHASRARQLLAAAGSTAATALDRRRIGLTARSRWLPPAANAPQAVPETPTRPDDPAQTADAPLADVIPLCPAATAEQDAPPADHLAAARAAAEAARRKYRHQR